MKKIRLFLNVSCRDTNVLFDKDSKLRLTLRSPYGEVTELTNGIKRAISSGKIIDIDGVSGIEVSSNMKAIHDRLLRLANITRCPLNEVEDIVEDTVTECENEVEVCEAVDTIEEEVVETAEVKEECEEQVEEIEEVKSTSKKGSKKKSGEK